MHSWLLRRKLGTGILKNQKFLEKLYVQLSRASQQLYSEHFLRETNIYVHVETWTKLFIETLFIMAKNQKQS